MNSDTAITQFRIKFTLNLLQSVDVMWVSSPYREKIVTFGSLNLWKRFAAKENCRDRVHISVSKIIRKESTHWSILIFQRCSTVHITGADMNKATMPLSYQRLCLRPLLH
jgi:hypothetical protein